MEKINHREQNRLGAGVSLKWTFEELQFVASLALSSLQLNRAAEFSTHRL